MRSLAPSLTHALARSRAHTNTNTHLPTHMRTTMSTQIGLHCRRPINLTTNNPTADRYDVPAAPFVPLEPVDGAWFLNLAFKKTPAATTAPLAYQQSLP